MNTFSCQGAGSCSVLSESKAAGAGGVFLAFLELVAQCGQQKSNWESKEQGDDGRRSGQQEGLGGG